MIPGEVFPAAGDITLNADCPTITLMVANTGDRPVQVGSHYHFAETNPGLEFDRAAESTLEAVNALGLPEAEEIMREFLGGYKLTLDEIKE